MDILPDSDLPFEQYISESKQILQKRRPQFVSKDIPPDLILESNSPYELRPSKPIMSQQKFKYGVLLVHGLFDSPFSVRDLGKRLQDNGVLSRAVLLAGHGTLPDDLITVKSEQWVNVVRYGINSLKDQVEQLYILGYSTGGILAIQQAFKGVNLAGIILIAPAIKIRIPVNPLLDIPSITNWFNFHPQWLYHRIEADYTKYLSVTFNSIKQVADLVASTMQSNPENKIHCPIFMAVSKDDQVISSYNAINFFKHYQHEHSRLIIYATTNEGHIDERIEVRKSCYPELNIKNFSHISIPFSPENPHYGQHGDYPEASRIDNTGVIYGSYNPVQIQLYRWFYKMWLMRLKRKELTYNPDFDYMADRILEFVLDN